MNYENLKDVTELSHQLEIIRRKLDTLARAAQDGVREGYIDIRCGPSPDGHSSSDYVRVNLPKGMALTIADAVARVEACEVKASLAQLGVDVPL